MNLASLLVVLFFFLAPKVQGSNTSAKLPQHNLRSPVGRGGMVELKDGRLMMVGASLTRKDAPADPFFDSIVEARPQTSVSYSKDGGRTWTAAEPLMIGGKPVEGGIDPVCLLRLKSGAIALVYGQEVQRDRGSPEGYNMFLRKSKDEGQSWSQPIQINLPNVTASPYHDTLTQLDSGRLLLPVRWFLSSRYPELEGEGSGSFAVFDGRRIKIESGHTHFPEMDTTFVYSSDDEGETWKASRELVIWHKEGFGGIWPTDEPSLAELKDGRVLLFLRTTLGRVYQSVSNDRGNTWHLPEPTELPASYTPARLRRLPASGDLLAIWNQVSRDEIRRGYGRGRLTLAISADDGKTWKNFKTLHASEGLENIAQLPPDREEIGMVRTLRNLGPMSLNRTVAHYANARFAGDQVYITYDYRGDLAFTNGRLEAKTRQQRLLIRPISWLYEP